MSHLWRKIIPAPYRIDGKISNNMGATPLRVPGMYSSSLIGILCGPHKLVFVKLSDQWLAHGKSAKENK